MIGFAKKNKNKLFLKLLAIISIWAGWYIAVCTKYAPWGFSDSAAYFAAARNFAAGKGLGLINPDGSFTPLAIFAPFYSLMLSFFSFLNIDLINSSRILNILCFSIFVASCGWLLYLLTKSFWLSLLFSVMITMTPVMSLNYSSMMSEPLALVLGIPGFLLMIYAIKQNSTRLLIFSAILCGLSLLTRYAFAAFPVASVIVIFFLSNRSFRQRISKVALFGIISFTPMLIWIFLQFFSKSSIGSRHYTFGFSLIDKATVFFTQVYSVVKYWLPYRTNMIPGVRSEVFRPILLFIFAGVILFGLFNSIKKFKDTDKNILSVTNISLATLIFSYLLVLLITFSISTETISLDERMLSPILPIFYGLILTCALVIGQKTHPKNPFPFIGVIIALFFVVYNTQPFRSYPIEVGNYPNGYTSPIWRENPILTGEVILSQERPIITNAPDIILFYLNRSAYTLTSNVHDAGSNLYIGDQTRMSEMVHEQCAFVVLFDPSTAQRFEQLPHPVTVEEISSLQNSLDFIYTSANGTVLSDTKCH